MEFLLIFFMFLFKRSNFQVISQFIHVKDISKVNDNGNQYKQKLILWYWTKNYFLMGFTPSKIYFYFGTISMFWNLNAAISHQFSKNIRRNFIPMVKMFWLSETADYFETDYHWQQMLAIDNKWHEFLFLVYLVISWRILCWKCQILSSLIENLLNIKTYTDIFGMQISNL
jgi:hypothetical protein